MQYKNIQLLLKNAEIRHFEIPDTEKALTVPRDYSVIDFIEEATSALNVDNVHTLCVKIRKQYGFDYFSFYVYLPRVSNKPLCYFMRDYASEWTDYYSRHNCLFADVSIRCTLFSVTPRIWRPDRFYGELTPPELEVADRAYDFGMRDLTCFPINGTHGDHGVIRFVHEQHGIAPYNSDEDLIRTVSQLSLLVHYIYEAMIRVLTMDDQAAELMPLSAREHEVLCWAARGKSCAAIGDILHISENTIKAHLKHIHNKLGVKTRQHAVAKAIALRLINP